MVPDDAEAPLSLSSTMTLSPALAINHQRRPTEEPHPYNVAADKFHLPPIIGSVRSNSESPAAHPRAVRSRAVRSFDSDSTIAADSKRGSDCEERKENDSYISGTGGDNVVAIMTVAGHRHNTTDTDTSSDSDAHSQVQRGPSLVSPMSQADLPLHSALSTHGMSLLSIPALPSAPLSSDQQATTSTVTVTGQAPSVVPPSPSVKPGINRKTVNNTSIANTDTTNDFRPRRRSSVNEDDVSAAASGSASALHPFWLRFRRDEIESFYLDFSSEKNDKEAWRLIILALFLYLVPFLVHQAFLSPFDYRFLIVRVVIFVPIFTLLLFRYTSVYLHSPRISQLSLLLVSLIFFLGENVDSFTLGDNQGLLETGTPIFLFWVFPALHLRFTHCFTVTALTIATRLVFTAVLATDLSPNFSFNSECRRVFSTNAILTLGHEAILFLVGLASLAYCWHSERLERREFWYRNLLAETVENNQILLQRMLPASVIAKLQKGDTIIAERFDHVTLLFADLIGFQNLVAQTSPVFVVHVLDYIFNAFDELSEQYGVYKVETVFDTWVGACGIQNDDADDDSALTREERERQRLLKTESQEEIALKRSINATRIAQLALAMVTLGEQLEFDIKKELEKWERKWMKRHFHFDGQSSGGETTDEEYEQQRLSLINSDEDNDSDTNTNNGSGSLLSLLTSQSLSLKVRVGIHSGGVMAGVIGRKLPRYRLFGDTVNTTARMCTNGTGGRVHVSPETVAILINSEVAPSFTFTDHATRMIKGKGMITTAYLMRDDSVLSQPVLPVYTNNSSVTFAAPEIVSQQDEIPATHTDTHAHNDSDAAINVPHRSASTSPKTEFKRMATMATTSSTDSHTGNRSPSPLNRLLALTKEPRLAHSHTFHSKPYFTSNRTSNSAATTLTFADLVHRNTQLQTNDSFEHWAEEARMTGVASIASISPTSVATRQQYKDNQKSLKQLSQSLFNPNILDNRFQFGQHGQQGKGGRHRALTAGADSVTTTKTHAQTHTDTSTHINSGTRRTGSAFVKKSHQSTVVPAPVVPQASTGQTPRSSTTGTTTNNDRFHSRSASAERFASPRSMNRRVPFTMHSHSRTHSYNGSAVRARPFLHDPTISIIESVGSAEHSETDSHRHRDSESQSQRNTARGSRNSHRRTLSKHSPRVKLKGYMSSDRPTGTGNPNPSSRASICNISRIETEERFSEDIHADSLAHNDNHPGNHTDALVANNLSSRSQHSRTQSPTSPRSQQMLTVNTMASYTLTDADNDANTANVIDSGGVAGASQAHPQLLSLSEPATTDLLAIDSDLPTHTVPSAQTPAPVRRLRPSHKRAVTLNDKEVKSMLGLSVTGKTKKNQIVPLSLTTLGGGQSKNRSRHRSMRSMQFTRAEVKSVRNDSAPVLQPHPVAERSHSSPQATPRSNLAPTPSSGNRSTQHSPTINSHHLPLPNGQHYQYSVGEGTDTGNGGRGSSFSTETHTPIHTGSLSVNTHTVITVNGPNVHAGSGVQPLSHDPVSSSHGSRHQSLKFSRSSRMNNISELKREKEKQHLTFANNKQHTRSHTHTGTGIGAYTTNDSGRGSGSVGSDDMFGTIAEFSDTEASPVPVTISSTKSLSMLALASLDTDDLPFHMLNPETMVFGYDLSFVDYPDLEKKYQRDQSKKIYQWIKTRLSLLLIVFVIVSAIDLTSRLANLSGFDPDDGPVLVGLGAWVRFIVRMGAGLLPCTIIVLAMIYSKTVTRLYRFQSHLSQLVLVLLSILSATLFLTDINNPNPNIDTWCGVIVLCGLASSLFRLPAIHNLIFVIWCTLCYTLTFLVIPLIHTDLIIFDKQSFKVSLAIQCLLFCICMFLLFYVNSRVMEIRTRERFLTLLAIKKQRKDTGALLERLLPRSIINQLIDLSRGENDNQNNYSSNHFGNTHAHINQGSGGGPNQNDDSLNTIVNTPQRPNRRQMSLASQSIGSLNRRLSSSRALSYQQRPATSDGTRHTQTGTSANQGRLVHSNSHSIKFTGHDHQRSASVALTPTVAANAHTQINAAMANAYGPSPQSMPSSLLASIFPSVTVMQADVCSFTPLCARSTAQQVITMLNSLFLLFDALTDQYRVYKVETIGDAVLAVCGAPIPDPHHAYRMAELSLAARDALKQFTPAHDQTPIRMRFGLHSGRVVGGVVGLKKMPRFHIYGQTVSHAGLMEQQAEPMTICMSETTWRAIKLSHPKAKANYEVKRILAGKEKETAPAVTTSHTNTGNDTPNHSEPDESGTSTSELGNDSEDEDTLTSTNTNRDKSLNDLRCYQLVRKRRATADGSGCGIIINGLPISVRPVTAGSHRAAKLTGDDPLTLAANMANIRSRASTDLLASY